jgi:DNA processing protein
MDHHDHLAAWLALTRVPGVGPITGKRLLEHFEQPERVLAADLFALRQVPGLTEAQAKAIQASQDLAALAAEIEALAGRGIGLLVYDEPLYPERLRQIPDPPLVLYCRGSLTEADRAAVAVVGCRNPDVYGQTMATRLGAGLAAAGATVVSGMARGIDSLAQQAALDAGGRTVAVLGTGVDVIYPPEHEELYQAIVERGAVLSEFPPGAEPAPGNFPVRNRIISGMSLGVVVVQAMSEKSGSLITAKLALEQNREVYAVPGGAASHAGRITNRLIKQGARLIEEAEDILEDLRPQLPDLPLMSLRRQGEGESVSSELSSQEQRLYTLLPELGEGSVHLDTLAAKSTLPVAEVSQHLLALELSGLVKKLPGNYYVKIG